MTRAAEVSRARGLAEVLTCAWCGAEFPSGTPTHRADGQDRRDALAQHAARCPKHPLAEALEVIRLLVDGPGGDFDLEAEERGRALLARFPS